MAALGSPRTEVLRKVSRWVILGGFTYLLVFPTGHNAVLLTVLVAMGAASLSLVVTGHQGLARGLRIPAVLSGILIALGVVVGIGNQGWAHSLIAWVAAPVLFWVWAVALTEDLIPHLLRIALGATIALSAVTLIFAFTIPTGLPAALHPFFGGDSDGFGFAAAVSIYGTTTLLATTPMWIVGSVLPLTRHLPSRAWMMAAAGSALLASVVSSRRATVVLALAAPVIILALYWLSRDRSKHVALSGRARAYILGGSVFAVILLAIASFMPIVQRTAQGVLGMVTGQARTPDERLRLAQIPELWEGFLSSPIWGHGIGATVDGFSRNKNRPWAFEMQYNMLLFQVGVLGAAILIASVVLVVLALWKASKARPDLRPLLAVVAASALSILIGNALNPMLQAPGHFWSVFLLIACINVALLSKRSAD